MSVSRVVHCDECGVAIVELLESESMTEEVIRAGGVTAAINPSGLDLCSTHLKKDRDAQQAVRSYVVATV
jgi:hypothetical protein